MKTPMTKLSETFDSMLPDIRFPDISGTNKRVDWAEARIQEHLESNMTPDQFNRAVNGIIDWLYYTQNVPMDEINDMKKRLGID